MPTNVTETPEIIGGKCVKRDAQGRWLPGGNPTIGRTRGKRDFVNELLDDLKLVEGEQRERILQHAWRKAFKRPDVLRDMLDRLPGLMSKVGNGNGGTHYHLTLNVSAPEAELARGLLAAIRNRSPQSAD